ncbi:MAG: hypothetical protein JW702_04845 [Clostridiales bacterium]|nr:hypothetical protein [Clostridiales bacterium]
MDTMILVIIGIITILVIGAAIAIHYYKKRNIAKLFDQVYETSKQVPKQKKNSFLLLMFMETMAESKKKSKSSANSNKLNNQKYLEIQLVKMSKILKDSSKVKDKTTKQSLALLKDYLAWEEEKQNKNSLSKQNKTA